MTEFELLTAQRDALLKELAEWQKKLSEAKFGKRGDEKKAIKRIEKQLKDNEKLLKKVNKMDYLETGLENGIDTRANMAKEIGGMVSSVATAGSNIFAGKFGVNGVGRAEQMKQKRLGNGSPQNPLAGMDKTTMVIMGAVALLFMVLMMKKR